MECEIVRRAARIPPPPTSGLPQNALCCARLAVGGGLAGDFDDATFPTWRACGADGLSEAAVASTTRQSLPWCKA